MGENYVLGNREDDNEFRPYKLHPKMFEENKVVMMGCGTQHAVALALDGPEGQLPKLDTAAFVKQPVPPGEEASEAEAVDEVQGEEPVLEQKAAQQQAAGAQEVGGQ